jgi:hypothetical protein
MGYGVRPHLSDMVYQMWGMGSDPTCQIWCARYGVWGQTSYDRYRVLDIVQVGNFFEFGIAGLFQSLSLLTPWIVLLYQSVPKPERVGVGILQGIFNLYIRTDSYSTAPPETPVGFPEALWRESLILYYITRSIRRKYGFSFWGGRYGEISSGQQPWRVCCCRYCP